MIFVKKLIYIKNMIDFGCVLYLIVDDMENTIKKSLRTV